MAKKPLAVIMAVTGNLAFAAGCVLLALRRHSPKLRADIIVYADGTLEQQDAALLRGLGADILPAPRQEAYLSESYLASFTPLALARLEGFMLLRRYATVLYLDVDIAVQGDIAPILEYGPFGVAFEDPAQLVGGHYNKAGINITAPIPGFDAEAHNVNSGVLLLRDTLPNPTGLYEICHKWLRMYARNMAFPDQAVVNLMAHHFLRNNPALLSYLPYELFNAHPCGPKAQHAVLAHAFGASKFWNDSLMGCFFPEWKRDYARWLGMGGAAWRGEPINCQLAEGGPYAMMQRLLGASVASQPYGGQYGLAGCGCQYGAKLHERMADGEKKL